MRLKGANYPALMPLEFGGRQSSQVDTLGIYSLNEAQTTGEQGSRLAAYTDLVVNSYLEVIPFGISVSSRKVEAPAAWMRLATRHAIHASSFPWETKIL